MLKHAPLYRQPLSRFLGKGSRVCTVVDGVAGIFYDQLGSLRRRQRKSGIDGLGVKRAQWSANAYISGSQHTADLVAKNIRDRPNPVQV